MGCYVYKYVYVYAYMVLTLYILLCRYIDIVVAATKLGETIKII